MARQGDVAGSTQALSAILFLYREILDVELPWLDEIEKAEKPQWLPVGMTRDEVVPCWRGSMARPD